MERSNSKLYKEPPCCIVGEDRIIASKPPNPKNPNSTNCIFDPDPEQEETYPDTKEDDKPEKID